MKDDRSESIHLYVLVGIGSWWMWHSLDLTLLLLVGIAIIASVAEWFN